MADELGPHRPVPRQNLTTGLVLIVDGEPAGRITAVIPVTCVIVEDDEGDEQQYTFEDADPAPIVADIIPAAGS